MVKKVSTSTPTPFYARIQLQNRIVIPKVVLDIQKLKKGDTVEATVKKVKVNK